MLEYWVIGDWYSVFIGETERFFLKINIPLFQMPDISYLLSKIHGSVCFRKSETLIKH